MQKILLLEDDISLVDGLTYSLKKNGYEIEVARTIKEAFRLLGEQPDFDLLLCDVTLPDGNGFALCEKLRESGNQVPIIFLTASDEETSVIRGLDCGGDDYITKPFKLGELCSRIRARRRRSSLGSNRECLAVGGPVGQSCGRQSFYRRRAGGIYRSRVQASLSAASKQRKNPYPRRTPGQTVGRRREFCR